MSGDSETDRRRAVAQVGSGRDRKRNQIGKGFLVSFKGRARCLPRRSAFDEGRSSPRRERRKSSNASAVGL
jgi:hypothetical protein